MNRLDLIQYVRVSEVARVLGIKTGTLYKRLGKNILNIHTKKIHVQHLPKCIIASHEISVLPKDITVPKKRYVIFKSIERRIADYFNVNVSDVIGSDRRSVNTTPRHILFYILHNTNKVSINRLKRRYNRSYKGITYGINKILDYKSYDKDYQQILKELS